MKSKFFNVNYKKITILATLSMMMVSGNIKSELEASVAKDLTIYSGGGGAGADLGMSYYRSKEGRNGVPFIQYGDNYNLGSSSVVQPGDPIPPTLPSSWNYIAGSPLISSYSGQYDDTISTYDPNNYFGGKVDGYSGTELPLIVSQNPNRNSLSQSGTYDPTAIVSVKNLRLVAGDGGNPLDPILSRSELMSPFIPYQNSLVLDQYNSSNADALSFHKGSDGSLLNYSMNQVELEGNATIISGNNGIVQGKTYRINLPGHNLNGQFLNSFGGSIGGAVDFTVNTLTLLNNNVLNFQRNGGDVSTLITNLVAKSNGYFNYDSMDALGTTSSVTIRNYDFWGGTVTHDQFSNNIVDLSGSTLNVHSRDLDNDNEYDLIHSSDYLTGNVNLSYTTNRLIEYRVVTDSGYVVIPRNLTSLDLNQYSNVHTIQAIFGYEAAFESNGGSAVDTQVPIRQSEYVVEPANPTFTGHIFKGWYTDQSLTSLYNFSTPVNSDIKLYAKWQNMFANVNLHFNSNGGSSIASQNLLINTAGVKPTDPTRTGYSFEGWYEDPSFVNVFDFTRLIIQDTTVHAKWTQVQVQPTVQKVNLIFESNGGTRIESQNLSINTAGVKPIDPTRSGYNFEGWYTNSSFDTMFDFNSLINQDTTVYAKWRQTQISSESPEKLPETGIQSNLEFSFVLVLIGIGTLMTNVSLKKKYNE